MERSPPRAIEPQIAANVAPSSALTRDRGRLGYARAERMRTFDTRPEVPFEWRIDVEARLARVPSDHTIKGLFCGSLLRLLDTPWETLRPLLVAPPADGRYVAYKDYPQVDYCHIALAAARQLFPEHPLPEAARLLARQDLEVFAASPIGRILFRAPRSLPGLLLHLPSLYRMVVRGGAIRSAALADGAVRLWFRDYHGWVDCYTVGTLEGIVLHYDREPRIRVLLEDETCAAYEIRWA